MGLDTILNLLTTYNLSSDELLLVYLTLLAQDEEGHPEYFKKWYDGGGQKNLGALFNSLKEKGVIHKNYNPNSYIPNEIEFNQNFLKQWHKISGTMGKDLFEAYPPFLYINGKYATLKNISKRFNSLEEFYFFYSVQIGHNVQKHKQIMELLEWAKQQDKINFGIVEFVVSHKWEELQLMKDNKLEGQIESTFNVYESI